MFEFKKTDDTEGQQRAIEWLRACVIAESGPAFLAPDRRKCELILARIEVLERTADKAKGSP